MVAAGMIEIATGDDSPSGRVPKRGLDWFSVATEACGGRTSHLGLPPGFLEYLGIYRVKRGCGNMDLYMEYPKHKQSCSEHVQRASVSPSFHLIRTSLRVLFVCSGGSTNSSYQG